MVLACSALAMSQTAGATVTSANSDGYGLGAKLDVLGLSLLNLSLPAGASGTAPGAYDQDKSVVSLDTSDELVLDVLGLVKTSVKAGATSGLINGTAYSNVDGSVGSKTTIASGSIDNLNLGAQLNVQILSALGPSITNITSLLGLNNVTLSSNAAVTGDYGTLSATGDSTIIDLNAGTGTNLSIFGLLNPIDLSAYLDVNGHAAANTYIDPLGALSDLGVTLVLNEQTGVCSTSTCSLEVNALHLSIDNLVFGVLGHTLVADIKLGHSYAEMSAAPVPVPAAAWLFGSGIIALVGLGRRRQA